MMEDTITVVTKVGFFNNETRTFKRDKVKVNTIHAVASCSACDPMGDIIEVETENGEIIRGYQTNEY